MMRRHMRSTVTNETIKKEVTMSYTGIPEMSPHTTNSSCCTIVLPVTCKKEMLPIFVAP